MARQIVIQPNGLYAVWSSVVDSFIETDLTKEAYIQWRISMLKEELEDDFQRIENGDLRFTMDYEECRSIMRMNERDF